MIRDVFGVSGPAILCALVAGGQSPLEMATLARDQLRRKRPQIVDALSVEVDEHRRSLLAIQVARLEAAETGIAAVDKMIADRLEPYRKYIDLLVIVPGID
jgi:hypothetical protein